MEEKTTMGERIEYKLNVKNEENYTENVTLWIDGTIEKIEREITDTTLLDSLPPFEGNATLMLILKIPEIQQFIQGKSKEIRTLTDTTVVYVQSTYFPEVKDSAVIITDLLCEIHIHNYENPCKDSTTFIFIIPEDGMVHLTVYDKAGRRVKNLINGEFYKKGIYLLKWNCRNDNNNQLAPGIYGYVLEVITKNNKKYSAHNKVLILP